jgi:thiamine biosynthesis protein ThiS
MRVTACLRARYRTDVSQWLCAAGWRIISGMDGQDTIEIIVNGDARQVSHGARVTDLVKQLELAPERLAIELNLSILPRAKWAETELRQGDRLEIVHFVGGG